MRRLASDKPGFVYVAYWADATKVGYSANPTKRIPQLRDDIGDGLGFSYIFEFPSQKEARRVEACAHRQLADKRISRWEYFRVTNAKAVEVIRECAGQDLVSRDVSDFTDRPEPLEPVPLREGATPAF